MPGKRELVWISKGGLNRKVVAKAWDLVFVSVRNRSSSVIPIFVEVRVGEPFSKQK